MTSRTREQKLARQIQAATGKPYTACLREAKAIIKEDPCFVFTAPSTTPSAASTARPPGGRSAA
jgi:hypothetical protein